MPSARLLPAAFAAWYAFGVSAHAADVPLGADTYVSTAAMSANYGNTATVNVAPNTTALMRFNLNSLPSGISPTQVQKATLVLYVNRVGVPGAVEVQTVGSAWNETSVTAATAPVNLRNGNRASAEVITAGQYVTIDVTDTVIGWLTSGESGNFGFSLQPAAAAPNTTVFFDSKENTLTGHGARLDVTLTSAAASGAMGPMGPMGPSGPQGPQGPQGAKGDTGATGMQGPKGETGSVGPAGPVGLQGLKGDTGAVGPAGPVGMPGPQGLQGSTGAPGATGPAGPAGPSGSGINRVNVTTATQQIQPNTAYIASRAGSVAFTLPSTPSIGDVVSVTGTGRGEWTIIPNPGQVIITEKIRGSGAATTSSPLRGKVYDAIELQYIGNNQFSVLNATGTVTTSFDTDHMFFGGMTWMFASTIIYHYETARAYCSTTMNGLSDWRLPSAAELEAAAKSGAIPSRWTFKYYFSSTPAQMSFITQNAYTGQAAVLSFTGHYQVFSDSGAITASNEYLEFPLDAVACVR